MSGAAIKVGDVVAWHPDANMNLDWAVTEIHGNGRLTIEVDIPEGDGVRTLRKSVYRRDCKVVAQQLSLLGLDPVAPSHGTGGGT